MTARECVRVHTVITRAIIIIAGCLIMVISILVFVPGRWSLSQLALRQLLGVAGNAFSSRRARRTSSSGRLRHLGFASLSLRSTGCSGLLETQYMHTMRGSAGA